MVAAMDRIVLQDGQPTVSRNAEASICQYLVAFRIFGVFCVACARTTRRKRVARPRYEERRETVCTPCIVERRSFPRNVRVLTARGDEASAAVARAANGGAAAVVNERDATSSVANPTASRRRVRECA